MDVAVDVDVAYQNLSKSRAGNLTRLVHENAMTPLALGISSLPDVTCLGMCGGVRWSTRKP